MHEHSKDLRPSLCPEMHILSLIDTNSQYKGHVFLYDAESRGRLLALLQELVADPDYEFSQTKADLVSNKVQKIAKDEQQQGAERNRQELE